MVAIEDSILNSTKKFLGINEEDTAFDADILMHINAAIFNMYQIGAISNIYQVDSAESTYEEMMSEDTTQDLGAIKSYIFYKVKLGFDTPASATVIESIKDQIKEIEWRLLVSGEMREINNDEEDEIVITPPIVEEEKPEEGDPENVRYRF